ncbi:MAG: macro domain-containing protein [Flavobacteriaceae bacterium]|nr:macro domain-containing protein [Flavobacteriaceae bacterium]
MIHYTKGDIFNSEAQAIINTVNTVGIMGKGIALQFKKRFPKNFAIYKKACDEKKLHIGSMLITETNSLFF